MKTKKQIVRLRERELKSGNKSLYLDIYWNGKRSKEYLKLYINTVKTGHIDHPKPFMKKLYTLLIFLLTYFTYFAQVPQGFNYQAIVRDASGNLITNQSVGVQVSVLQNEATGTEVYVE